MSSLPQKQIAQVAVPKVAPDRPHSPTLADRVYAVMSPAYMPRKEIRATMADVLEEKDDLEEDKKRQVGLLKDRNDIIKVLGSDIVWAKSELRRKTVVIASKDEVISQKDAIIARKDAIIASHVAKIASLKKSISLEGKDATISSQAKIIASKDESISQKDEVISTHVTKIKNQRKEVHALKESLAKRSAHIEKLLGNVNEHKMALASANHKLKQANEKLEDAGTNADDFEEVYEIKVQDITALQNQLGMEALQAVSGRVKHVLEELKAPDVKRAKLDGKAK
ncbi:hypothetical protein VTL71DRAFT_7983 [Oculimacula yallundae]|uniref:Uncharacterized protein n=1 Tax=Oculimacula yallundae TaxID=86028 RepID=A0ABR4CWD6_9HELO